MLRKLLPILLIAPLLFAACKKKASIPPEVIAEVGDRTITLEDFKRYLSRNAGVELAQLAPEAASALLDQYAEEALVSAYAAKHGFDVSAEQVAEEVRKDPGSTVFDKRDQMRRQRIAADLESGISTPTEEDVRAYYDLHAAEFNVDQRIRARQILVRERPLAEDIRKKLVAGASFEELSRAHSVAPNAREGGDIGYIARGQLPKAFEDELFSLQKGGISNVVQADQTYHIFVVDDVQPAGRLDYAAAAAIISGRLREDAIARAMGLVIRNAREEIPTRILTKRLPFPYSGALPRAMAE